MNSRTWRYLYIVATSARGSIQFLGPRMALSGEAQAKQEAIRQELAAVTRELAQRSKQLRTEAMAWEERLRATLDDSPHAHVPELRNFASAEGAASRTLDDGFEPGVPAVLHPLNEERCDRLALAKWLVDRRNPLVARVTVNRWWAEILGHGLVETVGGLRRQTRTADSP